MTGKVYLVGAGPGDYKLLTLKASECIQKADVIVYDRLANREYLKLTQPHCEKIYVGKVSSNHTLTQDEINDVIVNKAKEGKIVTRLKGGDPYVFGRGGEEGEYLLSHGIAFEVVPGITSAIGGLCYAGIPITHRDYTSSFHVVTGHLKDDEKDSINWNALAHMGGTLVFLMGVSNLEKICTNLIKEGMDKTTGAAIINWATTPRQKVVVGTLDTLYEKAVAEKVKSPSLIVVGNVVNLREKLNFFEHKPLFGQTIGVTRSRSQSSTLKEALENLGANVIEMPTIVIEPISLDESFDQIIKNLKAYTYTVFTSQNAVHLFFEALYERGLDARALGSMQVVSIGGATTKALKAYGIQRDIEPERFIAESLWEKLKEKLTSKDRVLLPKALETRSFLIEKISQVCSLDTVVLYENKLAKEQEEDFKTILKEEDLNYITFTSSSTVKNMVALLGENYQELLEGIKLISIGEVTSATMKALELEVYKQPEIFKIEEMIKMIVEDSKIKL